MTKMYGFIIQGHFSFDNLKAVCGELMVNLEERSDCVQCQEIYLNPCEHNQYYCTHCYGKDMDNSTLNLRRSCFQHCEFVEFNDFFTIHKSKTCLPCYRELTKEYTDHNLLMPAQNMYLPSVIDDKMIITSTQSFSPQQLGKIKRRNKSGRALLSNIQRIQQFKRQREKRRLKTNES